MPHLITEGIFVSLQSIQQISMLCVTLRNLVAVEVHELLRWRDVTEALLDGRQWWLARKHNILVTGSHGVRPK